MSLQELTLEEIESIDADGKAEAFAKALLPPGARHFFDDTTPTQRHTLFTASMIDEGKGRNPGLPKFCRYVLACGLDIGEATNYVTREYSAALGEDAQQRDVQHDVDHAMGSVLADTKPRASGDKSAAIMAPMPKTADTTLNSALVYDPTKLATFERTTAQQLSDASPVSNVTPRMFLESLFKPTDYVLTQADSKEPPLPSRLRDDVAAMVEADPASAFYIVPQMAKKEGGTTRKGKKSYRSSNAFNEKRLFLVMETDLDPENVERFTTYALQFSKAAPLAAVVDSGGKSFHFWFSVRGMRKTDIQAILDSAIHHGADPAPLRVICQLVRFPNNLAHTDERNAQRCIYLDPAAVGKKFDASALNEIRREENDTDELLSNIKYDSRKDDYYYRSFDDHIGKLTHWYKIGVKLLTAKLATAGVYAAKNGMPDSPMDHVFASFMDSENSVDYVLPIYPGKKSGVHRLKAKKYGVASGSDDLSKKYLVAQELPNLPIQSGECETVKRFIQNLLGKDQDQLDVFLTWLQRNATMYRARTVGDYEYRDSIRRMLNIVGDTSHGKSFLVENVIAPIFGDVFVNPAGMLMGNDFNGELLNAPLLVMDDAGEYPQGRIEIESYANRVKDVVTSHRSVTIHKKGSDREGNHDPMNFLVRLCNETHAVLESLCDFSDRSIMEKILIVRTASGFDGLTDPDDLDGIENVARRIRIELPAFYGWLLDEYETPAHLIDRSNGNRYGSVVYHNAEIIDMVVNENKDTRLERLLECLLSLRNERFSGKSTAQLDRGNGCERYVDVGDVPTITFTAAQLQDDLRYFLGMTAFGEDQIDLVKHLVGMKPIALTNNYLKPMVQIDYESGKDNKRLWKSDDALVKETGKFTARNKAKSIYYIFTPTGWDMIEGQNDFEF